MSKEVIEFTRPKIQEVFCVVEGLTPLIMHKWSEKAKREIWQKQQKKAKVGKDPRDPEKEMRDAIYVRHDGRYGFPAVGFKAAMVRAAKGMDGLSMIDVQTRVFVFSHDYDDLVLIVGEPTLREDMVRLQRSVADIRFRPEFKQWRALIRMRVNVDLLSLEQALNMLTLAGNFVGIGEWRPEKGGQFGLFELIYAGTNLEEALAIAENGLPKEAVAG